MKKEEEWRPSAICISEDSFNRQMAFNILNWISYKYGFGTYIHLIKGYYSKTTNTQADTELTHLIDSYRHKSNYVYIDTLISPSYTSAIAQTIQVPGIAGMENNMIIFEYDKSNSNNLTEIIDNISLVASGKFDICIAATSNLTPNYKNGIHIWISTLDYENANLMIMLSFIILGHPDWSKSNIKIFEICKPEKLEETEKRMQKLVLTGRLPITASNIEIILADEKTSKKTHINEKSRDSGLTIIGFRGENLKHSGTKIFEGYDEIGNILFINSHNEKQIE